ncbi:MAG TPA: hypothetical protein VFS57_06830 [Gemmatimonadaceae bacterium]|nr:hypothetical protein [Gemmatimonadaceae bacterium]
MSARVLVRQPRHDRVDEDRNAVVGDEVAPIESFANEHCVVVRVVVISGVQLVPATVDTGEHDRHAAHVRLAARRRDPERGVDALEQEFGARRRLRNARAVARGEQHAEHGDASGDNSARAAG